VRGTSAASRVKALDWPAVSTELDAQGWAVLPKLLTAADCDAMSSLYARESGFRSRIVMARHGFGCGEYRYCAYPLPRLVETLRTALYPHLVQIANCWQARMPSTPPLFSDATKLAKLAQRHCCFNTARAITIVFTRIFTASMSFRFKSRSCCPRPRRTLRVASLCWPNSVLACSRGHRLCRCIKATGSCLPSTIVRSADLATSTG
jgi:Oxygenase, catalysing oxidative methylation of damaged DNA